MRFPFLDLRCLLRPPALVAGLALALLPLVAGAQNAQPNPPPLVSTADNPLTPPDTSSPRATLLSFRAASGDAGRLLVEAYAEEEKEEGFFFSDSVRAKADRAEQLVMRASRCFDLSGVPPAALQSTRVESVLLLKEILDRIPLPTPEQIPDAFEIDRTADANHEPPLPSWTIPGTEIRIERITSGPSSGQYLFSSDTVSRLESFYDLLRARPPRPDAAVDLYDFYSLTPGTLLPPKWFPLVLALPSWTHVELYDQAVWQWLALLLGALLAIAILTGAFRWGRPRRSSNATAGRRFRPLVLPLLLIVVSLIFDHYIDEIINITGPVLRATTAVTEGIRVLAMAWLALVASNVFAEWILETPKIPSDSLDANLLRAAFRVAGLVAAALILGHGATMLGIPLVGVIAGLGVGGLAIALAAQPTIENFIGGIILYTDRPVRVGELCQFGEMRGVVEQIGIRSTRIRALDRTLITVPNSDFAKMRLVNFARRDRMLLNTTLGLRYETTPDQLRYVIARLRELLVAHPMVLADKRRVRFCGFGASSLDIEVNAYVATRVWEDFLGVREDLLFRMAEIVTDAGSGFAFPSQTTYFTRDSGLDKERQQAAEETVAEWRNASRLPYPDMTNETLDKLHGTLDWPPKGAELSPPAAPRKPNHGGADDGDGE
jgi:MscS family membrane protein